jgi:hypothetical protein
MRRCRRSLRCSPKDSASTSFSGRPVPTLRELQRSFAAALFDGADEALRVHLRPGRASPAGRLDIYRHRLRATFRRTLALEFPVVERLVGAEYFAGLARDLQCACPSRAGDLHYIGAAFAAFLATRFDGGTFDYLSHVARLEWAIEECLIAAEAQPLDARALKDIPPESCAMLCFEMHPACRLVSSRYPALAIWQANQSVAARIEIVDLRSGPTRVLVRRGPQGIEFHGLAAGEFALLEKIAHANCLGAALEAAQQEEADFDPGPPLRRAVALGVLTGARLAPVSRNAI